MKTLLACLILVLCSAAHAGTVTLPEPTIRQLNPGAYCATYITPNDPSAITIYTRQAIIGWSADGSQIFAKTYGSFPCGHSGRGSNITYYRWCGTFTWAITFDVSGNLNPVGVATYTADPTQCSTPYWEWDSGATFYNTVGYGATVQHVMVDYGYYAIGVATLLTP